MRLPYQPALPFLSRYPEVHVRTYVHDVSSRRGQRLLRSDVLRTRRSQTACHRDSSADLIQG